MAVEPTAAKLDADHAERMDGQYRYQRHIYDLTRKYYLFGRDRMIARSGVPRDGTLPRGRLRHGPQSPARPPALSDGKALRPRHFRGDACLCAGELSRRPWCRSCRWPMPPRSRPNLGVEGFDRIMISYALSMIPDWERRSTNCLRAKGRRIAAHRRLRPTGATARLVPPPAAGLAFPLPCHPPGDTREALATRADAVRGRLEFETIGRGAWHAVIRTGTA